MPSAINFDHLRRLAENAGANPEQTAHIADETVQRLRNAWTSEAGVEAKARFGTLADHYSHRLSVLPLCKAAG